MPDTLQSYLLAIIFAVLCSSLIALLFDIAIKAEKIKTDYFKTYESLVGYLKSLLLIGLLVYVTTTDIFSYFAQYLFPKDIHFEITVLDFYTHEPIDSVEVNVFMETSKKVTLTKKNDKPGTYTNFLSVRRDIKEATISIESNKYENFVNTIQAIQIDSIYYKKIFLHPKYYTFTLQTGECKINFIESAFSELKTFEIDQKNKLKIIGNCDILSME